MAFPNVVKALWAGGLLLSTPGHAANEVAVPRNNPFVRPPIQAQEIPLQPDAPPAAAEPNFVLRATVVSPHMPMANIDGTILTLGETIHDYRLISVSQGTATLYKDNTQLTLHLGDNEGADTQD